MAGVPGDLDVTLDCRPDTELKLVHIDDEINSRAFIDGGDNSSVRVIPAADNWSVKRRQDDAQGGLDCIKNGNCRKFARTCRSGASGLLSDGRNRISRLPNNAGELFVRYLKALAQDLDLHFVSQI